MYYYNLGELPKSLKEYQKAFSLESIGQLSREMMMDKIDAVKAEMAK